MGTVLMERVLPPVAFARLPFGEKVSIGQTSWPATRRGWPVVAIQPDGDGT